MELRPGYKMTEVGIIPEDWEIRMCSQLSERIMVGIVIRPTQYYVQNGVPALRSANIREDGITEADLVFISTQSNSLLAKSQTRSGDVLSVRTGYPGTSAVVLDRHAGWNCIDILITRPSAIVDSVFLAKWINSPFGKEQVLRNQGGLAQKHFNVGDMKNLFVALPERHEQLRIARTLEAIDCLLKKIERLIAKKRGLKQAAMQELLTGQTRLPGFTDPWSSAKLGMISSMQSGGTPPSAVGEYYDGNLPWVSISDMTKSGRAIFETDRSLTEAGLANSSARMLPKGTILYAMYASLGECSIAGVELCFSQAILGITPTKILATNFLFYFLISLKSVVKTLGQQGTQSNLNKNMVESFQIPLPSLPEQNAIAAVLSDMDAELAALEQRLAKTIALKQGMMQELLTGRIRLVVPEPARPELVHA